MVETSDIVVETSDKMIEVYDGLKKLFEDIFSRESDLKCVKDAKDREYKVFLDTSDSKP